MAHLINITLHSDERGQLAVAGNQLPFVAQRAYFIWPSATSPVRGQHRHKLNHQLLFCNTGTCKVRILKHGISTVFELQEKSAGLYLAPDDWHEMYDFSPHCALTVLASHPFDINDYIKEPLL